MNSLIRLSVPAACLRSHKWLFAPGKYWNSPRHSGLLLLLMFIFLTGCPRAPHSENVKPGDRDYPAVNPHPLDIISLTVIIPASIDAQISQVYTTRVTGGSVDSGPPCAFVQTLSQSRDQYYVAPAFELGRVKTDVFSGQLIVDRYLPGDCVWALAGVWYGVGNGTVDRAELLRVNGNVPPIIKGRLDIWCIRSRKRDPKSPEACMDIRVLQSQFPEEISAGTVETIVASGGGRGPPALLTPGIGPIIIQFHDLDAADKDLVLRLN